MTIKVEKGEKNSYSIGESANKYSHYINQFGSFSEKSKTELLFDPTIPGMYPENSIVFSRDVYTFMFATALLTIVSK